MSNKTTLNYLLERDIEMSEESNLLKAMIQYEIDNNITPMAGNPDDSQREK